MNGAAILHGEAIPEMVDVRHGLEEVGAGLQAQLDIALELFEDLLLELAHGALTLEQIADEEKGERAETEKGDAQGPLVAEVRVDKDERVHKDGQATGQHEDEDGGHDGELELATLETVEFLPIDGCHFLFPPKLERRATPDKAIRCVLPMLARRDAWCNRLAVQALRKR